MLQFYSAYLTCTVFASDAVIFMRNDAVQLARDLFTNANELAHLAEMNIVAKL